MEDHAIFLLSPEGRVLTWNVGAQKIKGYSPQEIIGESFTRFYPEDKKATGWPQEELRRAISEGRIQDEGWRVRKDGSRFWANVVITALKNKDGSLRGFLKITRDLSERRQAEETLRLSEERLRLMVESVQDYAIFMLDPFGNIISWNLGAERIKGYRANEVIGKHMSIFYSSEDLANRKPERELEIAKQEGKVEDEGWRVRKDRSHFWANVIITALYSPQGELRGFAKITRDLTERRQIEQLQMADRHKNEFLAMLAHELRNPLAPIRNGVEILKLTSAHNPQIQATTGMMERQVTHLVRLVDDLLDVSRIVNGKIHMDSNAIKVNDFIDRAIEEVKPLMSSRGHNLVIHRASTPLIVQGDVVRLSQVVSNLLSNAAKYTDEPNDITLDVETYEDEVIIRVRDQGIGMDRGDLMRIFNLFEQANDSHARIRGGLGIGLTLVKRIVEMHGGTVVATSAGLAKGSQFELRLPLSSANSADTTPRKFSKGLLPEKVKKRVLVIDDNRDAAMSVENLLQLWGHDVQIAHSGEEGLAKAGLFKPDVILLDIGMPGMSGYEVAKNLRAEYGYGGLVIIALTGYGQPEDRKRSLEAGFNYHLTKPPNPEALQELVELPIHTSSFDRGRGNSR